MRQQGRGRGRTATRAYARKKRWCRFKTYHQIYALRGCEGDIATYCLA